MYFKLSWRNLKKYFTDYVIYAVTLIALIAVMYTSLAFTIIGETENDLQANSLPAFIACVMVCLIAYINNYLLSRRSKELALYMYMGMDKNNITNLFFLELFGVSLFCFGIGTIFAAPLVNITILQSMKISIPTAIAVSAIIKTFLYFLIIQAIAFMWERKKIKELQIKDMLVKRLIGKEKNVCQRKISVWVNLFGICFIIFIILFMLIVSNLNEKVTVICIGLISIPFILSIMSFYRLLLEIFDKLRSKHSIIFYKKDRLLITAQLLTKRKANAMLFSLTALCLIVSILANITSLVFGKAEILFYKEDKFWMIIAQRLISVVFLVIFFSVLSIRQVTDLRELIKNIKILENLGKTKINIKFILLKQIAFHFFMPMIIPIGIVILIVQPFDQLLFPYTNQDSLLFNGLINYISCIILPMFLIYLLSAYITSIKMLEKSKSKFA